MSGPATDDEGQPINDNLLGDSLKDAQLLVWYAAREGLAVEDGVLDAIAKARAALRGGTLDTTVEAAFWMAFRDLAKSVEPVSVDSIKATFGLGTGWNAAKRTKRRYAVSAVAVLVLLLVVQIYWFVGTTLRTDLETDRAELDKIAGSMRELNQSIAALSDLIGAKEQERREHAEALTSTSRADITGETRAVLTRLGTEIDELKRQQASADLSYVNIQRRSERVSTVLTGNSTLLARWDFLTDMVAEPAASPEDGPADMPVPQAITQAKAQQWAPYNSYDDGRGEGSFSARVSERELALVDEQLRLELSLLSAKSMLAVLSQYLLPLLYGLLGSLAYILRTLSTEIERVTFTRGSDIRYSLRWPLGMLAGITVGLFFDPAQLSGVAAITPLGLAFLAGYGVELVFAALDRLVRAFTGEEARARPG